jgi:eukaryotic-like serine/threonine-protein kinase
VRLTPGTRVGPYEILALLGAGGMGEVYQAKDTRLRRNVALKVMSEALSVDANLLERFEREARVAGSLNHPNVVALYDVGVHEGKPYLVSELLQGESLRARLARPVPLETALDWSAQMAQGLAAAHERGIIHRDLKPENVFLTKEGHLKLIDFGIAKLAQAANLALPHGLLDETAPSSEDSTGTGQVLGTPGYMSPEQLRGETVDTRADCFSLGAVLYELLSGHRAFPAKTAAERAHAILNAEPEPLPVSTPAPLVQLVRRCLEKDPERRFQSARDVAFFLDAMRSASGAPVVGLPEPGGAKGRRWKRLLWPMVGGLVAIGVLAAVFVAARNTRTPTLTFEGVTSGRGRVTAGRFTSDGRIIYSAAWEGAPLEVTAWSPGQFEAQLLGDAALLSVSQSGELAVLLRPEYWGQELRGMLAILPRAGETPREIAEHTRGADWSRTGELAVVRMLSDGRQRLEYPLGSALIETTGAIQDPRVSPSGDAVAFIEYDSSGRSLKVVDRRGQGRTLTFIALGHGLAWVPSGKEVWFSDLGPQGGWALWATSLSAGGRRLVLQNLTEMRLEDISRDGRVLVNAVDWRVEVVVLRPQDQGEGRLEIPSFSGLAALSSDGRQLLFSRLGAPFVYLQKTDGSPPLNLGPGTAMDLSPDQKWALAQTEDDKLAVLPIGPGVPRTRSVPGLSISYARWLHDGKHILFTARSNENREVGLYVMPLEGGTAVRLGDAGVHALSTVHVSLDDRWVAAIDPNEILALYPTDGGVPVTLSELGSVDALGWSAEGQLWVRRNPTREVPRHLLLYDVLRRRILEERALPSIDRTGVIALEVSDITPDGRAVAFDFDRVVGNLILLDGLSPSPP